MGYSRLTYDEWMDEPGVCGSKLPQWARELAERGYESVSAVDFYDDIFGDDLEEERMPEDYRQGEYAGIAIERVPKFDAEGRPVLDKNGKQVFTGRRCTITKGNVALYDLIDRSENFCMIAPISYAGRSRTNENARYLYALCIEVDDIKQKGGLNELIYSWERKYQPIPKPTYVVCSGYGLHLYYVFERPIPLWKNVFESITEAKKNLTRRIWTGYVTEDSEPEKIQFESVNQAFRCVGSRTKGDSYAMAFQCGEKVTIEYINKFLPDDAKMVCIYKSHCSLQEAKEKYPEWYKRRIENGEENGHFSRYKPIYYNWIEKILDGQHGAVVGKRYHCLENLCSLAVQCNIAPEQVEEDCRMVAERFELLTNDDNNHFTEYDVLCALKTYQNASEQAYRRRIEFISKKTGIELIPNKRNGRSQKIHVQIMSSTRDVLYPDGSWRSQDGRPSKEQIVLEWRQQHPKGRKADCIRDTGLDKKTVYKWWDPGQYQKHTKDVEGKRKKQPKPLPEAYVVEGDPNMALKIREYREAGIRNVEILTREEFEEKAAVEKKKDKKGEKDT